MNRKDFLKNGFSKFVNRNLQIIEDGIEITKTSFKKQAKELEEKTSLEIQNLCYPPGYSNEQDFLELCTGCGDCIEACPYLVIFPVYDENLQQQFPRIDVNLNPCRLCEDFPCVSSCEEGALNLSSEMKPFFGKAALKEVFCLNQDETHCSACLEVCPENAIEMNTHLPSISDQCIGCGLCVMECPTYPKALNISIENKIDKK